MAKNISSFAPGFAVASPYGTEKVIIGHGQWGAIKGNFETNYGNMFTYWCRDLVPTEGKKAKNKAYIKMWGAGGNGAGSCCCMQGTPGVSPSLAKYTFCWDGDSDQVIICNGLANGCCRPACNGECGGGVAVYHCNSTGTARINRVCATSGCGGHTSCFWHYSDNCIYATCYNHGPNPQPCHSNQLCTGAEFYTSCVETEAGRVCGFDCFYCTQGRVNGFEAGNCCNRCDSAICGKPHFSGYPQKWSRHRMGYTHYRMFSPCQQTMGGWTTDCEMHCKFNYWPNGSGYYATGLSPIPGSACGGGCCCGGGGHPGMTMIWFEEEDK